MSRQIKEDLEAITGRILFGESTNVNKSMKVGKDITGDLEGETDKKGPSGSGSESTDAKKAEGKGKDATVATSTKGGKATSCNERSSKFEDLYKQVVNEENDGTSIEGGNFSDEINDFPANGPEEDEAAPIDEIEEETVGSLFSQAAEIFTKLGDLLGEDVLDDGDMLSDEAELGEDEMMAGEAVDSTPAPDSTAKLTGKGNMNVKGVKVVKKAVSSASAGQENGGNTANCPDTNLGPKTKLKGRGISIPNILHM